MDQWRPPRVPPKDTPLTGPAVVTEFFDSLRASGNTLVQYDLGWRGRSGVPEKGVVARFHTALCEILRYFVCLDQLDPTNVMSAELVVRWLVLIENAVARNPKQPDWEGLEHVVASKVSSTGAAEVPGFMSWLTNVQKDQAQVMKQGRLLREERAAEGKRQKEKDKTEK